MKTTNWWPVGLIYVLVILVAVAAFMLAVQIRTDLATGWVDSAIYHSLFLSKAEQIERFGSIYFAGRWPWILFGSAVFNAFSPALASAVFAYCVLSLIALSTYAFARCFMPPAAGALVGIIAACNLQAAQTVVAAYPSMAAVALFFLGAVVSVVSWRRDIWTLSFMAGVIYGIAVMTHPFIVVVGAPIYGVLWLLHRQRQSRKRLVFGFGATIVGGLAVLPISLLVFRGYALSGEVLTSMWATTKYSVVSGQGNWFNKTLDSFLLDGGAYLYFFAAILAVVIGLARHGWRWSNIERDHRAVYMLYLMPLFWLTVWDWLVRGVAMQYAFYQVFLYGVAALPLGVLATQAGLFEKRPLGSLAALVSIYMALLAAVLAGLDREAGMLPMLSIMAMALLITGAVQMVTKRMGISACLSAILILVAGVVAGLTRYGLSVHAPDVSGAPAIEVVKWATTIARENSPPTQPLLYAYNRDDYILGPEYPVRNDRWDFTFNGHRSFFNIFDTVAGVYLWDRSMLATDLSREIKPAVVNRILDQFKSASLLVMWTTVDRRQEISEKLLAAGFRAKESVAGVFLSEQFNYSWAIFQVERK